MKKILFGLALLLSYAPASQAAWVVVSADSDGNMSCFYADSNGQPYGNSLRDYMCHSFYGIGYGADGYRYCFNFDHDGNQYGSAVNGAHCQ